jgi:hypothetical protein
MMTLYKRDNARKKEQIIKFRKVKEKEQLGEFFWLLKDDTLTDLIGKLP